MTLDLKNLRLFERVAALGAIGRAGAEFNLSTTNATKRIQELEAELKVKLLNRTTRAVSLTPDGELFLEHAKKILEDVEDAYTALTDSATTISGTLRVTASASFGRSHIVPFIPEFLERYPNMKLDLNLSDTVLDIVEHGFDLAFRIGELAPSSLLAQKIDENPVWLFASPEYLERAGEPKVPQDLANHACLQLSSNKTWQMEGPDGKIHDVTVDGPLSVNLGEVMKEWVLSGVGVARCSLWLAGEDIQTGRLVPILTDYKVLPETNIWAVRPPGRLMPARVKAFLDFIQPKIIELNKCCYANKTGHSD